MKNVRFLSILTTTRIENDRADILNETYIVFVKTELIMQIAMYRMTGVGSIL